MSKVIVRSTSQKFNGLYFREAKPNSIEWTSFEMAAQVFDHENHAILTMAEAGIKNYEMTPSPKPREEYVPSRSTGFVRQGRS